ncbi:MAG: EamA family transporter [bacterium]
MTSQGDAGGLASPPDGPSATRVPGRRAPLEALAAAALFGAAAPLTKTLVYSLPALQLAGLLYLGAALAVVPLALRRQAGERLRLDAANRRRLLGAVLLGGIAAPLLFVLALKIASAASVALLLTLEVAATAALGALIFRDPLGARGWVGVAGIIAASALVAWGGGAPSVLASVLVGAACVGWALDNHLTALIDALPPARTTLIKGAVAGAFNLTLAALLTPSLPTLRAAGAALLIGGACYGLSLVLYIRAAQRLGAVRAQATFATAPFWGVGLAALVFGEGLSMVAAVAMGLAAGAVFLLLRDQHAHRHRHAALQHAHEHDHADGHHTHAHGDQSATSRHTHPHTHAETEHAHRHRPDLHHRHEH